MFSGVCCNIGLISCKQGGLFMGGIPLDFHDFGGSCVVNIYQPHVICHLRQSQSASRGLTKARKASLLQQGPGDHLPAPMFH